MQATYDRVKALGRKFIETPDNFWTIKIQPQRENYYLTIRGRPESYKNSSFNIKEEMGSYSRFYLNEESQVPEALRLISLAKLA